MKPFFRVTSLLLAILFLGAAAFAWIDLLKHGDLLSAPRLKPASAWLTAVRMPFALRLRRVGPRARRHSETKKTAQALQTHPEQTQSVPAQDPIFSDA